MESLTLAKVVSKPAIGLDDLVVAIGIADAREGGFKGEENVGRAQETLLESLTLAKVVSKVFNGENCNYHNIGIADAREGGFKDQAKANGAHLDIGIADAREGGFKLAAGWRVWLDSGSPAIPCPAPATHANPPPA